MRGINATQSIDGDGRNATANNAENDSRLGCLDDKAANILALDPAKIPTGTI